MQVGGVREGRKKFSKKHNRASNELENTHTHSFTHTHRLLSGHVFFACMRAACVCVNKFVCMLCVMYMRVNLSCVCVCVCLCLCFTVWWLFCHHHYIPDQYLFQLSLSMVHRIIHLTVCVCVCVCVRETGVPEQ